MCGGACWNPEKDKANHGQSELIFEIEEEEAEKDKANHGQSDLTQEDINRMLTEGKVRLLLPNFMPQL